jgi:hypothetical protein
MENSDNKKPQPPEHPVLEQAAKEIAEILKKHDIAGVVQMFTPGHNKYALHLQPSWSVVAVDVKGKLRMTQPIVDPENPKQAETKVLDTVRMLVNLRIYLTKMVGVIVQSEVAVREFFGVKPPPPKPPGPPNLPFKNQN